MSVRSRNAVSVAGSILVVGLHGRGADTEWARLLKGRTVFARSRAIAERVAQVPCSIEHAYDDLFEQQLAGVQDTIADDLARRSGQRDIAYLVPGPAWVGDATVAALRERTSVEISATVHELAFPAHVQVTDALLLAQAQERAPFDAGSTPLDANVPSVICNWHGNRVIEQASRRLRTIYGGSALPKEDQTGTITVDAREPLDGPASFSALMYITARLRRPDGCPWDREQTHESMLDDFASEVAEYAEAVRAGDWQHAAEELGDVLLNVMMQAQIGLEAGHFTIEDVLAGINAKLVRRHPHVFAGVEASTPDDVLAVWNAVKQQERAS